MIVVLKERDFLVNILLLRFLVIPPRFFPNTSVVVNDCTFSKMIGRCLLKPILFQFLVFLFIVNFFVVFDFIGVVSAQVPPAPLPRDSALTENVPPEQRFERFRIEQKIQQVTSPIPGITVTSPQPPVNLDDKSTKKIFKLNKIVFDPIPTTLSLAELESITNRYIAMDAVSIYDLYMMVTEIDSLFNRKRIIGRAGLPVQDIENGVIIVQIIEGKITKTQIKTKVQKSSICQQEQPTLKSTYRLLNRHFVKKQFHFDTKNSFNLQKLEDEILLYNRTFQSQLVADIEPGDDLGSSMLNLTHVLPKPITAGYYVDNSGRETSGKIRNGVYVTLADIVGLDESFFVSYDETKGSTALYMSGEIPISDHGTFFDMTYYYGTPTTIAGPFAVLNINGTSEQYKPGIKQIVINTKKHRLDGYVRYENYNSKTYFDTELNYAEKMESLSIGFDYTHRGKTSAIFAGLSITTGNAGTLDPGLPTYTHHNFYLMKFNLMKVWYPNKKTTFILRGNTSAALSDLPQSQIFQIGGTATVRGTPEGLMSGDSGYLISAEGRYTIWDGADLSLQQCGDVKPCESVAEQTKKSIYQKIKIELFGFLDHGGVFYRDYPPTMRSADFLSSLGVGGTVTFGKSLSATCGYGQPIFTAESHQSNYKEKIKHGNMFFSARVIY